jgi:hypothetical protein
MRLVSSIGPYALDMGINHLDGLSELSYLEYLAIPKVFVDEKIYTAPDIDFLGFTWNLALAVKDGRIYKISPQVLTTNPDEATGAFIAARKHLADKMGEPTERNGSRLILRVTPGNAILEQARHGGVYCVQFFITGGHLFNLGTL